MKKIILSVCALSAMVFTSCSYEVDMFETIGTPKGTLNVDCTYDTEMTRATATTSWIIKAGETTLKNGSNTIAEGTYTVTASNYTDLKTALTANEGWGDAFYTGSQSEVLVTKGQNTDVNINCGKAKNARLKTNFNLLPAFSDVMLVADIDYNEPTSYTGRKLVFNLTNADKLAYFEANKAIKCKLSYTFNETPKEKNFDFTLGDAATENVITVTTNDNGTITINLSNITYDDEFGTGKTNTITIDAVSGDEVATPSAE